MFSTGLPHNAASSRTYPRDQGIDKAEDEREEDEAVHHGGWGDSYPDELPGGMRVASAGAGDRSRDHAVRRAVQRARPADPPRHAGRGRCKLQRELKKTMVFITHDLMEALKLGNRIAIMRGRPRSCRWGRPRRSWRIRQTAYVADFIRDVPRAALTCAARSWRAGLERERPVVRRAIISPEHGRCRSRCRSSCARITAARHRGRRRTIWRRRPHRRLTAMLEADS